jgi:uncharacterized membrane protein HdeD (DUF308 family)
MPTDWIWSQLGPPGRYHGDFNLDPVGVEEEGERLLARHWKVIGAQSLLWIACGFALAAWPEPGTRTLATVMAVLALADGVLSGYAAFAVQLLRGVRRWLVLEAVVALVLAIALLALPGLSSTALLYVIAAWAMTKGVLKVNAARRLPLSGGRELLLHWSGMVSFVFGLVMLIVVLIEPSTGALDLLGLLAAFAVVTGVMQMVFASELRRLSRRDVP